MYSILSKSGKDYHVYYVSMATLTDVMHGYKTLQMYGFPIQSHGKHSRVHTILNQIQCMIQYNVRKFDSYESYLA